MQKTAINSTNIRSGALAVPPRAGMNNMANPKPFVPSVGRSARMDERCAACKSTNWVPRNRKTRLDVVSSLNKPLMICPSRPTGERSVVLRFPRPNQQSQCPRARTLISRNCRRPAPFSRRCAKRLSWAASASTLRIMRTCASCPRTPERGATSSPSRTAKFHVSIQ